MSLVTWFFEHYLLWLDSANHFSLVKFDFTFVKFDFTLVKFDFTPDGPQNCAKMATNVTKPIQNEMFGHFINQVEWKDTFHGIYDSISIPGC